MERTDRTPDDLFSGSEQGPIDFVREGMQVIDAAGEDLGEVALVRMGDPGADTVGAGQQRDGGLFQDVGEALGFGPEPDLPPAFRARLMRTGFIKIDGNGLTDTDLYVPADKIAGVAGDSVRLSVSRTQLLREE